VVIFGQVMGIDNYIAFVAVGLLVWNYISETISLGTSVFVREEAMIKGTVLPLSTYVFKLLAQSVIRFGYALAGCVGLILLGGMTPSPIWFYSLPGLLLLALAAPPVIAIMGLLGAMYRDMQFVVSNLLRVGMFITPVIWMRRDSLVLHWLYTLNPATYFIEAVRAPLVTGAAPVVALGVGSGVTLALWAIALAMLGALRSRLVFYL
jgi:lipopolysaccharide transport system permease protein